MKFVRGYIFPLWIFWFLVFFPFASIHSCLFRYFDMILPFFHCFHHEVPKVYLCSFARLLVLDFKAVCLFARQTPHGDTIPYFCPVSTN
ncbi:hypothetical protein BZA05DRAFT_395471 [Tricharina praecox]|uniref:uncharacterized protein n=1 Tax=Tricharina praecox TaxID=43433 RepID=UPI0022205D46|nr:uncharacterized protein BZA05DRAFT_395471 [Tricharina praecox]KAI5854037.1 hypothetical protein BZA05DRAFT_395471 [Tricharina praecox]